MTIVVVFAVSAATVLHAVVLIVLVVVVLTVTVIQLGVAASDAVVLSLATLRVATTGSCRKLNALVTTVGILSVAAEVLATAKVVSSTDKHHSSIGCSSSIKALTIVASAVILAVAAPKVVLTIVIKQLYYH